MTTRSIPKSTILLKLSKVLQLLSPQAFEPTHDEQSNLGNHSSHEDQSSRALRQLQQTYTLERRTFF